MGLDDFTYLGEVSDEMGDETTDEVNTRIIHMHNQGQLISGIKRKLSKYEMRFLLSELKDDNDEYWYLILRTIIKTYSLNSLKPYLSEGFGVLDIKKEVKKLLVFIKLKIMKLIDLNKIYEGIKRSELADLFKEVKAPKLMHMTLLYIDNDSLDLFKKTVLKENNSEYSEG